MNFKELKEQNDMILQNLDTYNKLKVQHYPNTNNENAIKCYYVAKSNSTIINHYKRAFDINAVKLANLIKDEIQKNTGKKFILDIVLDKTIQSELKDNFGDKYIEFYEYSLVLKEQDNKYDDLASEKFETNTIIPIAKNKSSIVTSDKSYLGFVKTDAFKSFERKTVNLIDNAQLYIRNFDRPEVCKVASKYNLEDYLWEIVEKEIELKKQEENKKLKDEIKSLNAKAKAISSNDIDYLI